MFGNRVVRSRDAFGALFAAQVEAVYVEAWLVVRDPAAAAEVTRETFRAAWADFRTAPPDMLGMWILGRARDRALLRLGSGPSALPPTGPMAVSEGERAVSLDRATLARIVASLTASGVPTGPVRRRSAERSPDEEPVVAVGSLPVGDEVSDTVGWKGTSGSEGLVFGSEKAFAAALGMPPAPGEAARTDRAASASDVDGSGGSRPWSVRRRLLALGMVGVVGGVGLGDPGPESDPGAENVGAVEQTIDEMDQPGLPAAEPGPAPEPHPEPGVEGGTPPGPEVADARDATDITGAEEIADTADVQAAPVGEGSDAVDDPGGSGGAASGASGGADADPLETATATGGRSPGDRPSGDGGSSGSGNSTTTQPPSTDPPPVVSGIHGTWLPSSDCRSDERMLTLSWVAGGADTARARPEGGTWRSVAPNVGLLTVCTDPALRWYVEVSNAGGTDTASVELGA